MKSYRKLLAAIFAACFLVVTAFAADASPTGTWKWSQQGRNGGAPSERQIQLELKDGKLTGKMKGYQGGQGEVPDTPISEATYKDGAVAFSIERTFGENKFVIKYTAKLEGDTLKGQSEFPGFGGGEPTKTDWVATRVK